MKFSISQSSHHHLSCWQLTPHHFSRRRAAIIRGEIRTAALLVVPAIVFFELFEMEVRPRGDFHWRKKQRRRWRQNGRNCVLEKWLALMRHLDSSRYCMRQLAITTPQCPPTRAPAETGQPGKPCNPQQHGPRRFAFQQCNVAMDVPHLQDELSFKFLDSPLSCLSLRFQTRHFLWHGYHFRQGSTSLQNANGPSTSAPTELSSHLYRPCSEGAEAMSLTGFGGGNSVASSAVSHQDERFLGEFWACPSLAHHSQIQPRIIIRIYMTQWKIVIVKIVPPIPRPRGHQGHGVMSAIAQRSHHFQEAFLVEVSRTWQDHFGVENSGTMRCPNWLCGRCVYSLGL